jgi:serine/threonine protein kinase/tetratricopeptide (TPR) repeat protein
MRCPNCGREGLWPGDRCAACQARRPSPVLSVLTPVPDDAETVFLGASVRPSPGAARADADTTGLPGGSADDSDTTGLPPSAGGVRHLPSPQTNTGPLAISQQFGTRYIIVRLLGIGGMGAVYQAWDAELSVTVALKVVRPEVMGDPAAARDIERRFKQELLLARQVTHRNVVRIHDLGEIDGIKYITMPYIEGEDLSSVLRAAGSLPVPRVMAIARQIAAGLEAAHAAGVVHRDLKPANIMLQKDGEAIIMDFGIARTAAAAEPRPVPAGPATPTAALSPDDEATRGASTHAGVIVGTIEYMAPEQARGQEIDQRADVYAFGLILYDLLVGRRRAEHAGGAREELQGRLDRPMPSVRSLVREVPQALDRLVSRCTEREAAWRYPSSSALVQALDHLDDRGKIRPIKRVVGLPLAVAVSAVLLSLPAFIWWYTRPPIQHDPVAVVIADLQNRTGDSAFDQTLEPMFRRALEDAGFITAYDRNSVRAIGVAIPMSLDETAARKLAVEQGLGAVLSGTIDRQGDGYRIAVKATRTVTDDVIADEQARVASKDEVLPSATRLMARVRSAFGDETSQSAQQFAMASLSATSLDVVRHYAAAMEAASANRFEEARQSAQQAVELDPNFGIGYLIAAVQSRNTGRQEDERKYLGEALRHLDGMTERERYHVRGSSYLATNDYQQCVKEYGEAIAKYPADVSGRNQLALCLSHLRQMNEAAAVMEGVVKILPGQPLFRDNLALYANYGSNFQIAEREARSVQGPDVYATLALAFAQLGQGAIAQARGSYEELALIGRRGPSYSASGLGDIATLEGRYADAVAILTKGVAENLAVKDTASAAAKFTAIAYAELSRGRSGAAIAAAEEALRHSQEVKTRFLAARTFVEAGADTKARPLMTALASELYDEPRAYAKIIEGGMALKAGDARQAVILLREANKLFDTWLGVFDLGRASLEAGLFTQADSAFDACLNARRGEALSLFVDEQPTYAYLAPVHYYLGRARQGLNSPRFTESYRQYLSLRGNSKDDILLPDVRKRAGT